MKAKKTPERMCIGCGQMKPKKELLRIVRNEEGYFPDPGGRSPGRGAYVCRNEECFKSLLKKHALERAFRERADEKAYRELLENLEGML